MTAVAEKTKAYDYRLHHGGLYPLGVSEESLMKLINEREAEILQHSKDMSEGKGNFTGVAFVSFKTENMKQEVLERYSFSGFKRFRNTFQWLKPKKEEESVLRLNGQILYISQAAEPGDVYWKNLHIEDKERYLRKFLGYVMSLLLLIMCAVVIYILLAKQDDLRKQMKGDESTIEEEVNANAMQIRVLTVVLAISVVIINKVLGFIIPFIGA